MNTKLAIILALASTGAYAQLPGEVGPPQPSLAGTAPKLFPSEQGAFKALEVATQLIESKAVQKGGCYNAVYPLSVNTGYDGSGSAVVGGAPNQVNLAIALGGAKNGKGRWYKVTGAGQLNGLDPVTFYTNINGKGSFNIGSSIQELSTTLDVTSDVTTLPDHFYGTIIKDYTRLNALQNVPVTPDNFFDDAGVPVSMVIDYGYQQITKNWYVAAKWWQQSATWRADGVNSGTWWKKTRVAPAGSCVIEVKLEGYGVEPADGVEGFNERGYISITTPNAGPYAAPKSGE